MILKWARKMSIFGWAVFSWESSRDLEVGTSFINFHNAFGLVGNFHQKIIILIPYGQIIR